MAFITLSTGRLVNINGATEWTASQSDSYRRVVETLYCTKDNEWILRKIVTPQPPRPGVAPSVQWIPYSHEMAQSWLQAKCTARRWTPQEPLQPPRALTKGTRLR